MPNFMDNPYGNVGSLLGMARSDYNARRGAEGTARKNKRIQNASEILFKTQFRGEQPSGEDVQFMSSLSDSDLMQATKAVKAFSDTMEANKKRQWGEQPLNLEEGGQLGQIADILKGQGITTRGGAESAIGAGWLDKIAGNVIPTPAEQRLSQEAEQGREQEGLLAEIMKGEAGYRSKGGPFGPGFEDIRPELSLGEMTNMGLTPETAMGYQDQLRKGQGARVKAKQPQSALYKEFEDHVQRNPEWQGTIFDYLKQKKAIEEKPSKGAMEFFSSTQRNYISGLYGQSQWNKLEPDIAQRALATTNRTKELMTENPKMAFEKAAQIAFNEDPDNRAAVIEKQYPGAYKGEDGNWYIDKDGKTFRIQPKQRK